jgi:hypothetical protein
MSGPYLITTMQHRASTPVHQGNVSGEMPITSRRAVATLDKARLAVHAAGPSLRDADDAIHVTGGTVGPLPDGTVIEVAQVSESFLYNAIRPSLCCPTCGIQRVYVSGSHLFDAYNEAQATEEEATMTEDAIAYYLVTVDPDGDVSAMKLIHPPMLSAFPPVSDRAFENQGDDDQSKCDSARDALAAIMPELDA